MEGLKLVLGTDYEEMLSAYRPSFLIYDIDLSRMTAKILLKKKKSLKTLIIRFEKKICMGTTYMYTIYIYIYV